MNAARVVAAAVAALLVAVAAAGCGGGERDERAPPGPAGAARWPDGARYELRLGWQPGARALAGTERIAFVNTGGAPLREVWLRAWPNALGSCARPLVDLTALEGGRIVDWRQGCTAAAVRLPGPVRPGGRGEVLLRLRVTAPRRADRFGIWRDVAYLGNALPILAVADRSGWHLPPYTRRGESFFSLTASWDVEVRVPAGLAVAATGTQRERAAVGRDELRLRFVAPRARDFALVIGRLRTTSARAAGVELRAVHRPGTPLRRVRRALATARAALRDYERWFGPYGAPELDLVEGPVGMEYPELVLAGDLGPVVVAHELAHQWWYGLVGDDQWTSPWLDEGFAEFAQARLPERVAPERLGACAGLPPAAGPPLTASMAAFAHRPPAAYVATVYLGGACALRDLERGIGRARMDRLLRDLVRDHRDGVMTTADVLAAVRRVAPPGYDVEGWMRRARIVAP